MKGGAAAWGTTAQTGGAVWRAWLIWGRRLDFFLEKKGARQVLGSPDLATLRP